MTGPVVGGPYGPYRQVRFHTFVANQMIPNSLCPFSPNEQAYISPTPMTLSPMAMHTDASAPQNDWIRLPVTAARQDCRQAMTGNAVIYLLRSQRIEQLRERHTLSD
jgi:hypothetical protein